MTAAEMKDEFLVLYDKITNFAAPGYEDDEISRFLSKAQERIVLHDYNPQGNKYQQGFEQTEQRRKDLQELVPPEVACTPSVLQTGVLPNATFFDLPIDCLYALGEEVTIGHPTDTCMNGKRIGVKPITQDEYRINRKNPFKKPFASNNDGVTWRLDRNIRRHELITDGIFTITTYHLSYLKKPNPIIIGANIIEGITGPQNCQLNTILHRRIIDEAVNIATGTTDPQSYQVKTIETQKGE